MEAAASTPQWFRRAVRRVALDAATATAVTVCGVVQYIYRPLLWLAGLAGRLGKAKAEWVLHFYF